MLSWVIDLIEEGLFFGLCQHPAFPPLEGGHNSPFLVFNKGAAPLFHLSE